jgi:hypothetical protein
MTLITLTFEQLETLLNKAYDTGEYWRSTGSDDYVRYDIQQGVVSDLIAEAKSLSIVDGSTIQETNN